MRYTLGDQVHNSRGAYKFINRNGLAFSGYYLLFIDSMMWFLVEHVSGYIKWMLVAVAAILAVVEVVFSSMYNFLSKSISAIHSTPKTATIKAIYKTGKHTAEKTNMTYTDVRSMIPQVYIHVAYNYTRTCRKVNNDIY